MSANIYPTFGRCKRMEFLGLPFDFISMEDAVALVEQFIADHQPRWLTCANAATVVWCQRNVRLKTLISSADMILCDGMGLMYASRLLGIPFPEMLSGPLMLDRLVRLAAERGYSIYLVGTKQEILRKAVARYQARYPTLRIAGYRDGYFTSQEKTDVIEHIRKCHPDILFVAMGTPREETFVRDHLQDLGVPICLDVGGALDVAAGIYKLAPAWMRKLALEWLYRLIQEPRRLWKRYLTTNTVFVYLVFRAFVSRRLLGWARPASARSRQQTPEE